MTSPDQGQVLSAAFSPDGNRIAYTWFEKDIRELRIIDVRNGRDDLLYRDPALRFCNVEDSSPDGTRVLSHFFWLDYTEQMAVISVADHSVLFPRPKEKYGGMFFAPDGAHLIFSAPQGPGESESDIYEVAIHGGAITTPCNRQTTT